MDSLLTFSKWKGCLDVKWWHALEVASSLLVLLALARLKNLATHPEGRCVAEARTKILYSYPYSRVLPKFWMPEPQTRILFGLWAFEPKSVRPQIRRPSHTCFSSVLGSLAYSRPSPANAQLLDLQNRQPDTIHLLLGKKFWIKWKSCGTPESSRWTN